VAAHKKNARRLNATIVHLDESGYMLQPLVRRTWAPRGCTPIIRCWDRRDRLSVVGAITVPPSALRSRRGRGALHRISAVFRVHTSNIKTPGATAFLRALDRRVRGPLIIVQDRSSVHQSATKLWLATRREDAPRVMVEWLPSYAPDLNPAEQLWNHSKRGTLANLAPHDRDDLRVHVRRSLTSQRHRPYLLASFFDLAGLPL
jgi:hypothetical protein